MWKLTRPGNQHDKLVRDTLLDLQDHRLVRIELVREDQRQVWVLTKRGHGEAKKLLEPKGIRVSALREEKYDPVTGKLLGAGYDDHSAAVTSTAAELHRAGIGHRLGFATEIPHRLAGGYVQRADLVVRAPAAGVPVMLLEIDRRTEDAHDLVAKLRRYWEWARLLPRDADKHTVDLVRSRLDAIDQLVDHEKRLWRRVYPPTDREGLVPVAFVFADTTEAKVANTVAVLEEAGRRYWGAAPVRDLLPGGDHGEGLQPDRAGRRHHPGATHGARRRRGGVAAPGAQGRTDPDRRARQSRRRRSLPPSVRPRRNGGRAAPCR
ncbi:replication-relaxation family protein [Streptomyces albogriseolus]